MHAGQFWDCMRPSDNEATALAHMFERMLYAPLQVASCLCLKSSSNVFFNMALVAAIVDRGTDIKKRLYTPLPLPQTHPFHILPPCHSSSLTACKPLPLPQIQQVFSTPSLFLRHCFCFYCFQAIVRLSVHLMSLPYYQSTTSTFLPANLLQASPCLQRCIPASSKWSTDWPLRYKR